MDKVHETLAKRLNLALAPALARVPPSKMLGMLKQYSIGFSFFFRARARAGARLRMFFFS